MRSPDKNHRHMLGTIYTTGSLQVAEMISASGFDWVLLDMEHSVLSIEQVQATYLEI